MNDIQPKPKLLDHKQNCQIRKDSKVQKGTGSILFFFSALLTFSNLSFAQGLFGDQLPISEKLTDMAMSVFAADIDGDGDMDVLSASLRDSKIAWYKNLSITTAVLPTTLNPDAFDLEENYPNPFNPETVIKYQLPKAARVRLEIYNIVGQKITTLVNREQRAGAHSVKWHGLDNSGRPAAFISTASRQNQRLPARRRSSKVAR